MITTTNFCTEWLVDEVSSTVTYIWCTKPGVATSSPQWQIQKIDSTTNPTTIKYPQLDGASNAGFQFIWDNRATYTY